MGIVESIQQPIHNWWTFTQLDSHRVIAHSLSRMCILVICLDWHITEGKFPHPAWHTHVGSFLADVFFPHLPGEGC